MMNKLFRYMYICIAIMCIVHSDILYAYKLRNTVDITVRWYARNNWPNNEIKGAVRKLFTHRRRGEGDRNILAPGLTTQNLSENLVNEIRTVIWLIPINREFPSSLVNLKGISHARLPSPETIFDIIVNADNTLLTLSLDGKELPSYYFYESDVPPAPPAPPAPSPFARLEYVPKASEPQPTEPTKIEPMPTQPLVSPSIKDKSSVPAQPEISVRPQPELKKDMQSLPLNIAQQPPRGVAVPTPSIKRSAERQAAAQIIPKPPVKAATVKKVAVVKKSIKRKAPVRAKQPAPKKVKPIKKPAPVKKASIKKVAPKPLSKAQQQKLKQQASAKAKKLQIQQQLIQKRLASAKAKKVKARAKKK